MNKRWNIKYRKKNRIETLQFSIKYGKNNKARGDKFKNIFQYFMKFIHMLEYIQNIFSKKTSSGCKRTKYI